jgi:L-asparaginase
MRHHAVLTMSVMIAITFVFSYVPELFVPGRLAPAGQKPRITVLSANDADLDGPDLNGCAWLGLAARLNALLKDDDVQGAVVTHDIDTIEETAYFLNLVVASDKPVVLAAGSLPAAVAAAADPRARGRGVLVTVENEIRAARSAAGLAGLVQTDRITWFARPEERHTSRSEFSIDGLKALPRVDIIYAHAGMSPDLILAALEHGATGLVIAGTGDGSLSRTALDTLAKATRRGVVVVRRSPAEGFVVSGEIDAPRSRVLLQLALTQTKDPARVQRMFDDY